MSLSKKVMESSDYIMKHSAKAEVLFNQLLIQQKLDLEIIYFFYAGIFKRGYVKDVMAVRRKVTETANEKHYLEVELTREGLYDMLPKPLFNLHQNPDFFINAEEDDEDKVQMENENQNRRFFQPIEQESFRLRLSIEERENLNFSGLKNPFFLFFLKQLYPETNNFPDDVNEMLFYLLPLSSKFSANLDQINLIFQIFFSTNITFNRVWKMIDCLDIHLLSKLGENLLLGLNYIVGETVPDGLVGLEITTGPIDVNEILEFMPKRLNHTLLNFLIKQFIPFEMEIKTNFQVVPVSDSFRCGSMSNTCYLGYSTVLEM